jgi:hypothetical protein
MDFFDLAMKFVGSTAHEVSPGRLFESIFLLAIIWKKLRPSLDQINDRLLSLEKIVGEGFKSGESRFSHIEFRLAKLENPKPLGVSQNEQRV